MRTSICFLFLSFLIFGCTTKPTEENTSYASEEPDTVAAVESEYNEWGEKKIRPIEITEEEFAAIYKGKKKMHFKGYRDIDTIIMEFQGGRDSAEYVPKRFEDAHDLYIKNFSKKGFDFVLDTYTTPSPCRIEGKAFFDFCCYAEYTDTVGCRLNFHFYNDTIEIWSQGCHIYYCGAHAGLDDIYVLQKK